MFPAVLTRADLLDAPIGPRAVFVSDQCFFRPHLETHLYFHATYTGENGTFQTLRDVHGK